MFAANRNHAEKLEKIVQSLYAKVRCIWMQIHLGQHWARFRNIIRRVSLKQVFLKVHSSYLLLVHGKYSTIISMLHIYQFTFLFQLFKRREKLSHANGIYFKTNTCN